MRAAFLRTVRSNLCQSCSGRLAKYDTAARMAKPIGDNISKAADTLDKIKEGET